MLNYAKTKIRSVFLLHSATHKLLKFLLFSITVTTLFLPLTATAYQLPKLGDPGYEGLSRVQEDALGVQFMSYIRQHLPLIQDPLVLEYVQTLGYWLVKHTDSPHRQFRFFVVNDSSINAFAGPGGYIGINSGLINAAQSEGELAGVMAHEIAHVTQRHIARSIASMKNLQAINIAAIVAAAALGASNSQAAQGLAVASTAGSYQSMLNFTREHEEEADQIGMETLAKSGYQPTDMAKFFLRLLSQARLNNVGNTPSFLSTHPHTVSRIVESENRSKSYTVINPRPNNPNFYFVRARSLVDSSNNIFSLVRQLQAKASQNSPAATQYAYALALYKADQLNKAATLLAKLQQQYPANLYIAVSNAQVLAARGHGQQALQQLDSLYKTNRTHLAIAIIYANMLLQYNQAKQAVTVLKNTSGNTSGNELYLALLAQAQGQEGKLGEAYLTRARLYRLLYGDKAALIQLQQGLKMTHDRYTKARIQFEIQRLQRDIAFNDRVR